MKRKKKSAVTHLEKLTKQLHPRQKELITLLYMGESIAGGEYITTAHFMNGLVVEKIVEDKWYDIKKNKYVAKLTPRGNFFYKEYLAKEGHQ